MNNIHTNIENIYAFKGDTQTLKSDVIIKQQKMKTFQNMKWGKCVITYAATIFHNCKKQ